MDYKLKIKDSFGHQLEVLQELPQKGDKLPTVILVPGFGMDLHEYGLFDEVSDTLIKNGFQTFRFSFEGSGDSEGAFIETTIEKQVQQVKDIIDYVMHDRFTQKAQIGIFAQSFGTVAISQALPLPGIKTYLFTGTPPDPYTSMEKWFKRMHGYNPESISQIERFDKRKTKVGPDFWKTLAKVNMVKNLNHLEQPILFIHGGNDKRIRYWKVEEFFQSLQVKNKRLHVIEKADHTFTGVYRPVLLKLTADWFNETLR